MKALRKLVTLGRSVRRWAACLVGRHAWEQRSTRYGGLYEACAHCPRERIGGMVIDLARARAGRVRR